MSWTQERKARQAELIRQSQPWEKSTGPRTDEGKASSSGNAWKHGLRTAAEIEEHRRVNSLLRECRDMLKRIK